jgi:hypothetical protein
MGPVEPVDIKFFQLIAIILRALLFTMSSFPRHGTSTTQTKYPC